MAAVVLENVSKSFGKVDVIQQVYIHIRDGEFVVFVGPSGCGKSTLLRLIAGLEELSSGEIFIDDANVSHLPPSERNIAMVFQSYALYPHMTVAENMGFGLKLKHFPAHEIESRVLSASRILQIEPLLERKPKALSGGQRQRVAIGRAIVTEPKVFLFDEPLSNLDAALRVQMRIELSKLHRDLKTTIIYVTHDQIEAMTLANKIVVLNAGKVEQIGSPMEVYLYPDNMFVAGFIGSPKMNFIHATLDESSDSHARVTTPGGKLRARVDAAQASPGDAVILGVRPEHCQLKPSPDVDSLNGEVLMVEHLGDETLTYLEVEGAEENVIVREEGEFSDIKVGDQIRIGLPQQQCHLFDSNGKAFKRAPADEDEAAAASGSDASTSDISS